MIVAGIDGGSRTLKGVLLDSGDGRVLAGAVRDQGVEHERLAREVLEELLEPAGRRPHGATSQALLLDEGSLKDGMLVANGYRFVVYTAAPDGLPLRRRRPAMGPRHDRYVAYAWPIRPGVTGNAIFGMDSSGEVHLCENPPSSFSESDLMTDRYRTEGRLPEEVRKDFSLAADLDNGAPQTPRPRRGRKRRKK